MAGLYSDSKTFVDKKLRMDPQIVLSNFNILMNQTGNQPTKQQLQSFVDDYFDVEGSEFIPWDPVDWVANPPFLDHIDNIDLKEWGQKLNEAWKFLGRQIKGMDLTFISSYRKSA